MNSGAAATKRWCRAGPRSSCCSPTARCSCCARRSARARMSPPGNNLAMSGWLELLSLEALLFTISIAFILLAMAKERTEYRHRAAARTDPLTGIANRRGFLEQTAVSRRAAAGRQPTAVLLFDLDHFKTDQRPLRPRRRRPRAADFRRHRQGACRRRPARSGAGAATNSSRCSTTPAREHRGDDWRSASSSRWRRRPPTSTAGWSAPRSAPAWCSAATAPFELPAMLLQADQALYRAKSDGRNRLAIATPERPPATSRNRRRQHRADRPPQRGGLSSCARAARLPSDLWRER